MEDAKTALRPESLELVLIHRSIAGSEVDGSFRDLLDSRARTQRLIIDLNIRMKLVVLTEPFGIHRIRECRARAIDQDGSRGRTYSEHKQDTKQCKNLSHISLP